MMQKAMSYNQLYYLGVIPQDNELYHHGILGMHWGVRHDHYPLSASEHTAAEKKAGYKKSIGGGTNESLYGRKARKANRVANRYDKKIAAVERDIKSFDPIKNGFYTKSGRQILSKDDVSSMVGALKGNKKALEEKKAAKLAGIEASERLATERKSEKISNKIDKKLEKSRAYDEKIFEAREKNQQKISDKYDKKIARTQGEIEYFKDNFSKNDAAPVISDLKKEKNYLKERKAAKLADFRFGTKAIKAGAKQYNQILESYKGAKLSALKDKAYKKDPNYKKAVRDYVFQSLSDANHYGASGMTKLQYSGKAARSTVNRIKELKASGKTVTQIAQMTGYSKATVERYA